MKGRFKGKEDGKRKDMYADGRFVYLVCRVHIRMLFVLDIPWDSVTLDPYVHLEFSSCVQGRFTHEYSIRILECSDLVAFQRLKYLMSPLSFLKYIKLYTLYKYYIIFRLFFLKILYQFFKKLHCNKDIITDFFYYFFRLLTS